MINFDDVNQAALAHCPSLLEKLLPGGKIRGREYICGNLSGGNGESLSVNCDTGKWADFATAEGGKDLVALVAAQDNVNQHEAARRLAAMISVALPAENRSGGNMKQGSQQKEKPEPIMPVPDGVNPPAEIVHPTKGKPDEVFAYCSETGRLLGFVCRFNQATTNSAGKQRKDFCPMIYTAMGWRWQGFPAPYPFYDLQNLPEMPSEAPIIILEGEGKARELKRLAGQNMAVLGLYGGSGKAENMDYSPLIGRDVVYWPDNDVAGANAALAFARKSRGIVASIKIVRPPDDAPAAWDVGDAIKEGWDFARIKDWISANRLDPNEFEELARERWEIGGKPTKPGQQDKKPAIQSVNIADFVTMKIPVREALLDPIILEKGHAMIFAARGTGKTYAALSIAWAVASGGEVFGRWRAPRPRKVLLIDGEMPARSLQERLMAIGNASDTDITQPENLRIISADMQEEGLPNLSTDEGQKAIEPFVDAVDLVIVDNLSTLAAYGKSNEAESWLPMQAWLLALRRKGKTALLIHHASKSGDQRGTSSREDILETVINLKRPSDYEPRQGARFECHFTKGRNLFGKDAMPFEARLVGDGGKQRWVTQTLENAELDKVQSLLDEGYTIRDIADEMGCSRGKIEHLKKKLAKRDGQ